MIKVISIFLLVSLGGCAVAERSVTHIYSGEDAGFALISIKAERYVGDFSVCMRRVDNPRKDRFAMIYDNGYYHPPKDPDFQQGIASGKVEQFSLMPGLYEVYDYQVFTAGGSIVGKNFQPVQFEIKPGKVTYIGEYYFHDIRSGISKNVQLSVEQQLNRDVQLISNRPAERTIISENEKSQYYKSLDNRCRIGPKWMPF